MKVEEVMVRFKFQIQRHIAAVGDVIFKQGPRIKWNESCLCNNTSLGLLLYRDKRQTESQMRGWLMIC